jgi:hypothetical protein
MTTSNRTKTSAGLAATVAPALPNIPRFATDRFRTIKG